MHFDPVIADEQMRRQLEVLRNSEDGSERGSLLWLVNHTKTAMGSRLMRSWVTHPLKRVHMINQRLDAVQELAADAGDHPPHILCQTTSTSTELKHRSKRWMCLKICISERSIMSRNLASVDKAFTPSLCCQACKAVPWSG